MSQIFQRLIFYETNVSRLQNEKELQKLDSVKSVVPPKTLMYLSMKGVLGTYVYIQGLQIERVDNA